ncbi:DUF3824 domain-containing protein [Arthrobacter sp. B6]|uniref:DUF3824 domain-containing protein n=1 Tax=Arthrobacter sp. B6 TaxID=1570137 RepID=UPI000AAD62DE|nr:DUF3824 domain-containing protein [Arthrobacter sp. B6]
MQQPPRGGGPPWQPQPGSGPPQWGGQPAWGPPPGQGHPPQWGQPPYNPHGGPPPYRPPQYVAPPKPGIIPLRPLMFGEIIDGSFQTIRRNAKAMLGAALLAQSLVVVLTAVLTASSVASAASLESWIESLNDQDMVSVGFAFLATVLLVGVLTVFLSAVLQGAMVVPVARSVLNRTTGVRQMWMLARSRAGALIRLACLMVLGWLLGMALFVGLAVFVVAAAGGIGALILLPVGFGGVALSVWIYIKILVAPAAVVIEELGAVDGLRRSWQLTRGNWWRVLGITLVVAIMVGIIAQVVTIPVSLLPAFYTSVVSPHGGADQAIAAAVAMAVVTAIVTALVGAVGYAFQTAVMALLYLDLRMRKDGLDIALLRLLESGADPDGVPGRGIPVHGGPGQGSPANTSGPLYRAWPDVR